MIYLNKLNRCFIFHMKRTYEYSIYELYIFKKSISIKANECETFNDLKTRIAFDLQISSNQLSFKNLPEEDFKSIDPHHVFELSISSTHPDITIIIPNGQKKVIKDGYKKTFNDIIKYIEEENYYYSQLCIEENLDLYLSDKKISKDGYPFLSSKENSIFTIKLKMLNIAILNYAKFQFTVLENEKKKLSEIN